MGMRLFADEAAPVPRPVTLAVTCDGDHDGGLLTSGVPEATFPLADGDHPRDPAVRAGWKFSPDGLVLCPSCARR